MSSTYGDVDGYADPALAVYWQERVDGWPQVRAYKRRIADLVAGAERLVDVGCGPGLDDRGAGPGRAIGVDRSRTMCRAAASRGRVTCQADACALPFPDGHLDAAVADRVLQHIERRPAALSEMVRVVRRGGRVVVADPDQETLVIHVPGVPPELTARVKRLRRDVGYRHGRYVSGLPAELTALGLGDVTVDAFPLVLTDPDDAFGVPTWPRAWRDEGEFTDRELEAWDAGIERGRRGGFVYALLYFVVSATVPSRTRSEGVSVAQS